MVNLGSSVYDLDIDASCPRCSYQVWVRGVEVAVQTTVLCPVCRTRLQLVDEEASMSSVEREIDSAIEDLRKEFKKGFG